MKRKIFKLFSLMLVGVLLVMTLASCSSYGKIKSNFKSEGYIELKSGEDSTAKTITAELEKGNISCEIHVLQKELDDDAGFIANVINNVKTVVILEFSSDKEIVEAIKNSETLSKLIGDIQKSEYVRDNCVLITLDSSAKDIFNK